MLAYYSRDRSKSKATNKTPSGNVTQQYSSTFELKLNNNSTQHIQSSDLLPSRQLINSPFFALISRSPSCVIVEDPYLKCINVRRFSVKEGLIELTISCRLSFLFCWENEQESSKKLRWTPKMNTQKRYRIMSRVGAEEVIRLIILLNVSFSFVNKQYRKLFMWFRHLMTRAWSMATCNSLNNLLEMVFCFALSPEANSECSKKAVEWSAELETKQQTPTPNGAVYVMLWT